MADRELCRCRAEAEWLGDDVEVILGPRALVLTDRTTSARVAIDLERITSVEHNGFLLRVRVPTKGQIEFAGVHFDGWYPFAIPDPEARGLVVSRLNAGIGQRRPLRNRRRASQS